MLYNTIYLVADDARHLEIDQGRGLLKEWRLLKDADQMEWLNAMTGEREILHGLTSGVKEGVLFLRLPHTGKSQRPSKNNSTWIDYFNINILRVMVKRGYTRHRFSPNEAGGKGGKTRAQEVPARAPTCLELHHDVLARCPQITQKSLFFENVVREDRRYRGEGQEAVNVRGSGDRVGSGAELAMENGSRTAHGRPATGVHTITRAPIIVFSFCLNFL